MAIIAPGHNTPTRIRDVPPLRASPHETDRFDSKRAEYLLGLWHSQDELLRGRDRQIEENVRILVGQHWIVYSEIRQQFVDVARYLNDDERRWRQMPTMNRIMLWFMLVQARVTENPPVITWKPGPDSVDAELAEVLDPIFKWVWNDVGMLEQLDRMFAWLIPAGQAHLKSRINPNKGELIEYREDAMLELMDPTGGQPIQRMASGVPFGPDGEDGAFQPRAELQFDDQAGEYGYIETGDAHEEYEGGIDVDVLSPLEVRGSWGPTPWDQKRAHFHRSFLTPEEFFECYGFEVEPDVRGAQSESVGMVMRLLHGSGLFGSASGRERGLLDVSHPQQEYVTVYEGWFAPSKRIQGMQRTSSSAGGRLLVVTGNRTVVRDGPRWGAFKYTSPIRCFQFLNMPGRPSGTSPQEMLNGPQRTRNRLDGQILQHGTLVANPTQLIDTSTGLQKGDVKNLPGQQVYVNMAGMVGDPVRFTKPPDLGRDVHLAREMLTEELMTLGNIHGSEGKPPTRNASGQLVEELRFNSDRFVGPMLRRAVVELARLAEDWAVMIPVCWTREKTLAVAGDDNIARTVTVYPEMFTGTVNAEPEVESMLPEGRGERLARIERMWLSGVWGDPLSFEARMMYLDMSRFPHMGRASRPGGIDRSTAEQNVGKLLQGVPALEIPIFEWYDHGVHLFVIERFMKSPEYLKVDPAVQQECVILRSIILEAQLWAQAALAERAAVTAGAAAVANVGAAATEQQAAAAAGILPAPPDKGATREATPGSRSASAA